MHGPFDGQTEAIADSVAGTRSRPQRVLSSAGLDPT